MAIITLASSGCQSTYKSDAEYRQEAITSAPLLTQQYARSIMDKHTPINLATDFTQGKADYRRQVFGSIATQQAQLAGTPTFVKFKINLTTQMYNGDVGAFIIPFNSVQLEEKGTPQDFDVTVIMTSGLWVEHTSKSMNYATWNESALKGIAIAAMSSAKEVDRANTEDEKTSHFYNLRSPNGIYLPEHENDEYFSTNKRSNAKWLDHYLRVGNNNKTQELTQYVKASPTEAKTIIGKDVTAIISVLAVFEVGKTGQLIVIGNPINSLLLDTNGRKSSGHIEKLYHWND